MGSLSTQLERLHVRSSGTVRFGRHLLELVFRLPRSHRQRSVRSSGFYNSDSGGNIGESEPGSKRGESGVGNNLHERYLAFAHCRNPGCGGNTMRIGMGYIHRGGMGQGNTLASTPAELAAFCAAQSHPESWPACAAVSASDFAAAQANLPLGKAQALATQYAPPVCQSSFTPSSNPSDWTQASYAINNTAAGVCSQVNDENGRRYQAYQNALENWSNYGGPQPPPPTYVTFNDYWSQQRLGPAPASVSLAPAGTQIPSSGYTTGALAPGGSGYALVGPATPPAVAQPSIPPAQITQQQLAQATNTPPVSPGPGDVTTGAGDHAPSSSSGGASSGGAGGSASTRNFLTDTSIDSIPNWVLLAAAAALIFFLVKK